MVEDQLLALSRRVAAAADAWLSDPRDVGAYGRLVDAVSEWRAFVRPPLPGLDVPARVISTVALPASGGAAPLGGPLAEVPPETAADQPARPLAEHLRGDPGRCWTGCEPAGTADPEPAPAELADAT